MKFFLEKEYFDIVKDIIENEVFLSLKSFTHHRNICRLDHCLTVSYSAYILAKRNNLDFVSIARAGLLHDFFLYEENPRGHVFSHPKVALENSSKYFALNPKEQNIILSHMWPLTTTWPTSKEAWIIIRVDKTVAVRDYLELLPSFSVGTVENTIQFSTDKE